MRIIGFSISSLIKNQQNHHFKNEHQRKRKSQLTMRKFSMQKTDSVNCHRYYNKHENIVLK